ncbi:hypothetical protein H257_17765 [Aphanomyces astaci]|uniref:Uncharacterized protein n=1 Tax=Aphanomyces astaci TaxID=112090 RepID=W4FFC9_APHAT|nr:hypothetical protein H257_17765 [Aphanomyces astaci]ETV65569.1 hypothetical protein H257_17765 [Aphanomyces astaci]|eukprot:XP_009844958.1 hypothetical protein H257_17765 [Aphanomyces astaci]
MCSRGSFKPEFVAVAAVVIARFCKARPVAIMVSNPFLCTSMATHWTTRRRNLWGRMQTERSAIELHLSVLERSTRHVLGRLYGVANQLKQYFAPHRQRFRYLGQLVPR